MSLYVSHECQTPSKTFATFRETAAVLLFLFESLLYISIECASLDSQCSYGGIFFSVPFSLSFVMMIFSATLLSVDRKLINL